MTGAAAGIYVGVFRNPDLLEGPFLRQLRCDDPLLPGSRDRYAAFVFDDGATGAIFGWEGVFTPFNNLANMALARQLSRCGEIGVRTVLIGTGESSFKPFYGTFAESFDEVHPGFDSFEKTHIAARSR